MLSSKKKKSGEKMSSHFSYTEQELLWWPAETAVWCTCHNCPINCFLYLTFEEENKQRWKIASLSFSYSRVIMIIEPYFIERVSDIMLGLVSVGFHF